MVAALVAGALFSKQLLWTPISAINMGEITTNQFKMSNASFAGTDSDGLPYRFRAVAGRQEYDNPDIVLLERVSGTYNRKSDGQIIRNDVSANAGQYNRAARTITLSGNVRVDTSTGDKLLTDQLVIKL